MRSRLHSIFLATGLVVLSATAPAAQVSAAKGHAEEAPPPPGVAVGDTAPDFTLQDQTLTEISLRDYRGKKNVILAFYVFAFTGG